VEGTELRILVVLLPLWLVISVADAEYGDVILNRYAEKADMRPVVFPHWFHRMRFRCKVCHHELGFEMRAGANDVTMDEIIDGRYCGMCHNGDVAWSVENCDLCHSGLPGQKSRVIGGHQTGGPGRW
jgi:c(7)-type cytochrome triheme protein